MHTIHFILHQMALLTLTLAVPISLVSVLINWRRGERGILVVGLAIMGSLLLMLWGTFLRGSSPAGTGRHTVAADLIEFAGTLSLCATVLIRSRLIKRFPKIPAPVADLPGDDEHAWPPPPKTPFLP
jgi:hypothetical protein